MAILSKIRDRSLALIAVIGLALFAFVLDPSTLTDFFDSAKINEVGEVDGETISRQDYAEALDSYNARTNGRVTEMQAGNVVWDNLLKNKIYSNQLEEAGVTVGENDVWTKMVATASGSNNPDFLNELGLFDENKFKQFLVDAREGEDQSVWKAWDNYKNQLEVDIKRQTYINLVNAGLGASLKEGEFQYNEDNTSINGDLVYIPYSAIADSLITVTKKDVEKYVNNNPLSFQVDASRNISYVKFEIKATETDEENLKNEVTSVLEDKKEYSSVVKNEVDVLGLKNATDYPLFFEEHNESDAPYAEFFYMKSELPADVADDILAGSEGDTFGAYKDRNYFKISKILEVVERPDSVKASNIFIPYIGSAGAIESTTKTDEQAKVSADSIFKLVRNNKKRFAEIANIINPEGDKAKGGDIGWTKHSPSFNSNRFDSNLAKFLFDNKTGEIEVVKSKFGYHVIRIDDQRNKQKAVKLVTYAREIVPSQDTENIVFQNAEKFALAISGKDNQYFKVAKEKQYKTVPAIGLKVLDEKIPGLPATNRQIVTWAFNKDTKIGAYKRFDIDNGYVVVMLTAKEKEGTMNASRAINRVKPILVNEKKAALIKDKMKGATLNDIAVANKVTVRKVNGVAVKSPSISGVGYEPKIVGAMSHAKENTLYNAVEGNKGVFAFVVTGNTPAAKLPNYESLRLLIAQDRKNKETKIFEALKEALDVEDNRATYYGVQQ
jgi:peptidylprolyl isomerase/peptidyl-prolyl cis-trans isomerase D